MIPIDRASGTNMPGMCYLDVVDVLDVESFPTVEGANITTPVVLKPGKQWHRVTLALPGSRFIESWSLIQGSRVADCTVSGTIGKDELTKLTALWSLPITRFLVLCVGLNGDALLAGSVLEGCRALVNERDRGDEADPKNGYRISWKVRRSDPAPFYLAPLPLDPGQVCPTLPQLLVSNTFEVILAALPPDKYAQFAEYFGQVGEYCPSLEELLEDVTPQEIVDALSDEQQDGVAELLITEIDGGEADTEFDDEVDGGDDDDDPDEPSEGGDFDPDDFEPDDFVTE